MINKRDIWNSCLNSIENKVGRSVFELWFKPMRLSEMTDGHIKLDIPNRFYREWVEENYADIIQSTLLETAGLEVDVRYNIQDREEPGKGKAVAGTSANKTGTRGRRAHLNPKYTFERFVGGPSNQFARSAALKVAESPGTVYNPLFIYGGVGLGKTHLINAAGNMVFDNNPGVTVLYVQSEQFTNEMVAAIRHDRMGAFKERYRKVDMLLIDDIQFISNKPQTQEEFFHTFNALYEEQKQIVLSSDRPPREIQDITDRLKSRFVMGLTADIQPPSLELKIAILKEKSEEQGIKLPKDVTYWLGEKVKSSVRDLEGCLIKLGAHSSLAGVPISIEMATDVLQDFLDDEDRPITVDKIQKVVADFYGIRQKDLKSKRRTKDIALPRQTAMYLGRELTDRSLSDIGKSFGGKDHATVIYACKQMGIRRETDKAYNRLIENLTNKIKG